MTPALLRVPALRRDRKSLLGQLPTTRFPWRQTAIRHRLPRATRGSFSLLAGEAVRRCLLESNPVRDARPVREAKTTITAAGALDPEDEQMDRTVLPAPPAARHP